MIKININGVQQDIDAEPDMPLLWAMRDLIAYDRHQIRLRHGAMRCLHGASRRATGSVLSNPDRRCRGRPRSPPSRAFPARVAETVQTVWTDLDVPQCGYCQSGQIMSAVALLSENKKPGDADIDAAMSGNLCRCATYARIRSAIHEAARRLEA